MGYVVLFIIVTIGLFNLIMATFVDNVVCRQVARRQKQNVENQEHIKVRMCESVLGIIGNSLNTGNEDTNKAFQNITGELVQRICANDMDRGDFHRKQAIVERA